MEAGGRNYAPGQMAIPPMRNSALTRSITAFRSLIIRYSLFIIH